MHNGDTISSSQSPTCIDNTLVKALARAFRWRKLMGVGVFAAVEGIAAAEKINAPYARRVLRLTLLAPDIVEAQGEVLFQEARAHQH